MTAQIGLGFLVANTSISTDNNIYKNLAKQPGPDLIVNCLVCDRNVNF